MDANAVVGVVVVDTDTVIRVAGASHRHHLLSVIVDLERVPCTLSEHEHQTLQRCYDICRGGNVALTLHHRDDGVTEEPGLWTEFTNDSDLVRWRNVIESGYMWMMRNCRRKEYRR